MKDKHKSIILLFSFLFALCYLSCTFDYGESESSDDNQPDLIMRDVEYVRVRSSDPIARFQAELAERYDKLGVMRLQNFVFEQYGERGEEVNAYGMAGFASVDIDSGDIFMDNGVRIEVESEDIIIETNQLEWKDEDRLLFTREEEEVNIFQNKGTGFTGTGLRVDARNRIWEFMGNVSGIYIHEDAEEEIEEETEVIEEFNYVENELYSGDFLI